MLEIARLDKAAREDLFVNTGHKTGMNPAIIEKDFWVCFILDHLFHRSQWKDAFVFKGGTSLSKAFHVIERFSEDIDLIMDWRLIDCSDELAWQERSRNKQDQFGKELVKAASGFLSGTFIQSLGDGLEKELGYKITVAMDEYDEDQCTVNIYYDHAFSDSYLRPEIRLEIGPLAEWTPSHERVIRPFAAEAYPNAFTTGSTQIRTVDAERTFWEKVLILHKTAYSCKEKGVPHRYARHYYDLYCMYNSDIKDGAFARRELLEQDAMFKQKFYYAKSARYDVAKPGSIKLVPEDSESISRLSEDYKNMKDMIYGTAPDFEAILATIQTLQDEINSMN